MQTDMTVCEDLQEIFFSKSYLFDKSRFIIKRLASEKHKERICVPRVLSGGDSIGIWGCISHKGIGF